MQEAQYQWPQLALQGRVKFPKQMGQQSSTGGPNESSLCVVVIIISSIVLHSIHTSEF
jgi:hypothetical protein